MSPDQTKKDIQAAHNATDRIVSLADLLLGPANVADVEYRIKDGQVMRGQFVAHTPTCAIQYVFGNAGTTVTEHIHAEKEWIIILKGRVREGGQIRLPGDDMVYEPRQPHSMDFLEDTLLLCVTVPGSPAFPRQTNG